MQGAGWQKLREATKSLCQKVFLGEGGGVGLAMTNVSYLNLSCIDLELGWLLTMCGRV